jgi:HPt (histidine-containing phosphotransfer) domain-containing protein
MMPEMDGVETVRRIRNLGGKYEKLTIVALTANAVQSARKMFFDSGFNDFISKPIDTNELYEIVKKHLPPEKISIQSDVEDQKSRLSKEEELFRKAAITFVKENQNIFENITISLNSGDTKTAHRIAHTLKSSAGYLGKKKLQDAAFSLEQSLHGESASCTPEQLNVLERELEKALCEFKPLLKRIEARKTKAVQIDGDKLVALFTELEPLLKMGDFDAANYVEELQGIFGMGELAQRVDDYDFEGALKLMSEIRELQL